MIIKDTKNENILWQSEDGLVLKAFHGEEARSYAEQIVRLRMKIFAEFPYLYQSTVEDELKYLNSYFISKNCAILLVVKGEEIVAYSTAVPADDRAIIKEAFAKNGQKSDDHYYIGELVVTEPYRGMGLLRKFIEYQEAFAKRCGYKKLAFINVKRPENHPLRPQNFRPHEPIWEHFGYHLVEGFELESTWQQSDTRKEEENIIVFRSKTL
jgi:GNAT superfamily N-acetyltransferase